MKGVLKKLPERSAARKRLKPINTNYISYNTLSAERRAVFFDAGLANYLRDAEKILFGSRKGILYNARYVTRPIYRARNAALINIYIEYALEMIASYNSRFDKIASVQHKFFLRTSEQEVFFTYLFAGMQLQKRKFLDKNIPDSTELLLPFVGNMHQRLEDYNTEKSCFKIRGKAVSERKIFAAGIFYAINFIFDAVEKGDTDRISAIKKDLLDFGLGTSYRESHGKRGGLQSKNEEIKNKELAYQIFIDNNVYVEYGPKHAAMCKELMHYLTEASIEATSVTVEKKWIPDFVDKCKKSL